MQRLLDACLRTRPCLLAVAAPREMRAVLDGLGGGEPPPAWEAARVSERVWVVLTGVGKANAAGAVSKALSEHSFGAVLSVGLAGALPGRTPMGVGERLVADACVLADEGIRLAEGFRSQSELGFPALEGCGERFDSDPVVLEALRPLADAVGACATVSACSGLDQAAEEITRRTRALAEDMESAAAALAAARLGTPFGCVRVISNRTGDRSRQGWDLESALAGLSQAASAI